MAPTRALVIEDEPAHNDFLARLIAQAGLEVLRAHSGADALQLCQQHPDTLFAVTDMKLPDMPGMDLLPQLHTLLPDCVIVVATMFDEPSMIAEAFEKGCNVFLVKPYGFMELYRRLTEFPARRDHLARLLIDQYGPRPYLG